MIALATTATIVAGAFVYAKVIRPRVFPKRWGEVAAGKIYRSGQIHPALVERILVDRSIEVIVDLTALQPDNAAQQAELAAASAHGVEHRCYPLSGDGTGDIEQYAQAIARIVTAKRAGDTVLVHCSAGTYRTGGVVACYRTLVEGWSAEQAVAEMRDYRWDPDQPALPMYLDAHMAELASRLVQLGVIERVPERLPIFSSPN